MGRARIAMQVEIPEEVEQDFRLFVVHARWKDSLIKMPTYRGNGKSAQNQKITSKEYRKHSKKVKWKGGDSCGADNGGGICRSERLYSAVCQTINFNGKLKANERFGAGGKNGLSYSIPLAECPPAVIKKVQQTPQEGSRAKA